MVTEPLPTRQMTRRRRRLTQAEIDSLPVIVFRSKEERAPGDGNGNGDGNEITEIQESNLNINSQEASLNINSQGTFKSQESITMNVQDQSDSKSIQSKEIPGEEIEMSDFHITTTHPQILILSPQVHEKTTDETCCLCLEDYEEGERLRELVCKHRYHVECVDEWLSAKRRCPVCNADAIGAKEEEEEELTVDVDDMMVVDERGVVVETGVVVESPVPSTNRV